MSLVQDTVHFFFVFYTFLFSFEDYKVFVEAFHSQLDGYGDTAWQGS